MHKDEESSSAKQQRTSQPVLPLAKLSLKPGNTDSEDQRWPDSAQGRQGWCQGKGTGLAQTFHKIVLGVCVCCVCVCDIRW